MRCPSCGNEAGSGRFCPNCAAPLDFDGATEAGPVMPRTAFHTPTPSAIGEMGFAPGEMFSGRYRIVGMLGQGGMGEVYRADDLKLGHPVALKFLSGKHSKDEALLQRFVGEVRLARQVSHPNVCRVYDIGESDGRHYLSMEYVDGEDLASLLKRIGRLPSDKALEVARQLCAGLAAAHDKGVLHRDLKPANIMLDGRGHARITDFGLAVAAGQESGERGLAGTPAYMAPEQLTGGEITTRTDLYALGLILYEVFTGKRPFEGRTVAERLKAIESVKTTSVTGIAGTDPAVERAILRCLEKDPAKRPVSARAVAGALPGGDPLAAMVAAGETPSPEMVANAGESEGLRVPVVLGCLAVIVLGLVAVLFLFRNVGLIHQAPLRRSPAALEAKARELLDSLGYPGPMKHTASGFTPVSDYLIYAMQQPDRAGRWERLKSNRPPAICFWYRESSEYMTPHQSANISQSDPPSTAPEARDLLLDSEGRLIELQARAPLATESSAAAATPDWNRLFAAAGLDPARFKPGASTGTPLVAADVRRAWEGSYGESSDTIRVEAGSLQGKPVFFKITGPWSRSKGIPDEVWAFVFLFLIALPAVAALIAWRNTRLGRGDARGAFRLGLFAFLVDVLAFIFGGSHVPAMSEAGLAWEHICRALGGAGVLWVLYLAFEPYVRRFWPQTIISWSRILSGRLRDPLVGGDLLVAVAVAVGWMVLSLILGLSLILLGNPIFAPNVPFLDGSAMGALLAQIGGSMGAGLSLMFALCLLRMMVRRPWLAAAVFTVLFTLFFSPGFGIEMLPSSLLLGILAVVLIRFGLLTTVTFLFSYFLLASFPLTTDFTAWYSGSTLLALSALLLLAGYGAHTTLAGRTLWKDELTPESS